MHSFAAPHHVGKHMLRACTGTHTQIVAAPAALDIVSLHASHELTCNIGRGGLAAITALSSLRR